MMNVDSDNVTDNTLFRRTDMGLIAKSKPSIEIDSFIGYGLIQSLSNKDQHDYDFYLGASVNKPIIIDLIEATGKDNEKDNMPKATDNDEVISNNNHEDIKLLVGDSIDSLVFVMTQHKANDRQPIYCLCMKIDIYKRVFDQNSELNKQIFDKNIIESNDWIVCKIFDFINRKGPQISLLDGVEKLKYIVMTLVTQLKPVMSNNDYRRIFHPHEAVNTKLIAQSGKDIVSQDSVSQDPVSQDPVCQVDTIRTRGAAGRKNVVFFADQQFPDQYKRKAKVDMNIVNSKAASQQRGKQRKSSANVIKAKKVKNTKVTKGGSLYKKKTVKEEVEVIEDNGNNSADENNDIKSEDNFESTKSNQKMIKGSRNNNIGLQTKKHFYDDALSELEIVEKRQRLEHQRNLDNADIMKRTLEMM